jgi:membrane-associated phospholipid phosphatase
MNKTIANFLSIIFHPLTIMTYMVVVLLLLNPFLFGKNDIAQGWAVALQVFFSTFCLPAMAVAIMKGLDLVSSFQMEDRKERIIPYIATATFYLWVFMMMRKNPGIPHILTTAMLGSIIGIFVSFFINNFSKISAHAVGVGGLIGLVIIAMRWYAYSYFYFDYFGAKIELGAYWLFIICVLIGGLVCSARLWLKAHDMKDIAMGFAVGLITQWAAFTFYA